MGETGFRKCRPCSKIIIFTYCFLLCPSRFLSLKLVLALQDVALVVTFPNSSPPPLPPSTHIVPCAQPSYSMSLTHSETVMSIYYVPGMEMSRSKGEQDTVLCPQGTHSLIGRQTSKNILMQCD